MCSVLFNVRRKPKHPKLPKTKWKRISSLTSETSDGQIGRRLSAIRVGEGLSQAKFAASLGVSHRTYCNIENGTRDPSAAVIKKLFDVYQLAPNWVLLGRGLPRQGEESEALFQFLEQLDQYHAAYHNDEPSRKKNRIAVKWLETLRSARGSLSSEFEFLYGLLKG